MDQQKRQARAPFDDMWDKKIKNGDWITVEAKTGCLRIIGKVISIVAGTYEIEMSDHAKRYVNPSSFDLIAVVRS